MIEMQLNSLTHFPCYLVNEIKKMLAFLTKNRLSILLIGCLG